MKKQEQFLNELIATLGVHYIKLHQYHWYVEGIGFFALHEKFEELYDETTENLDLVAERLLQLEGKPVSTLAEFVEHSFIKEAKYKKMSAEDMIKETIADYTLLREKVVAGYEVFDGDEVTTDMLVGLQTGIDKTLWMLKAFTA